VLEAETVHLEVLGTPNCYRRTERTEPFRIAWLNHLIVTALMEVNRRPHAATSFDFAFRQFPESFVWTASDHNRLLTCEPNTDCWNALRSKVQAAVVNREGVVLTA
jgi:hypothetical protein